jgi:hypothetical protein
VNVVPVPNEAPPAEPLEVAYQLIVPPAHPLALSETVPVPHREPAVVVGAEGGVQGAGRVTDEGGQTPPE